MTRRESDIVSDETLEMYAAKSDAFHVARMARELLAARKALAELDAKVQMAGSRVEAWQERSAKYEAECAALHKVIETQKRTLVARDKWLDAAASNSITLREHVATLRDVLRSANESFIVGSHRPSDLISHYKRRCEEALRATEGKP